MTDNATPSATPAPEQVPSPQSSLPPSVTEAHAREALVQDIKGAVEKGRLTKEQADAHLARIGATPAEQQPAEPPRPDASNPETLPGFEPGKAADFKMPENLDELNRLVDGTPGQELTAAQSVELTATFANIMEEARFPAAVGNAIAKIGGDHIRANAGYDALSDGAKQAYEITEKSKFDRLFSDKADESLALARQLARELVQRNPRLADLLNKTGLGSNHQFMAQMAVHARRLAAKQAGKG